MLPRRAFLGAELPGDAEAFFEGGVRIAGVIAGGMAERAGLRGGDTLRAIDDAPVRDLAELAAALRLAGGRPSVRLAFVRDGAPHDAIVPVVPQPLETVAGARVAYGALEAAGARLRTIEVWPEAPRALVLVIAGIACESIDHALSPEAPLAGLVAGWARAGLASLRYDKRGVGDSEGTPCRHVDFATELADARAALATAIERARGLPVVIFGHSVGGMIAAALARPPIAGVIVYGAPVMPWLDCLRDSTRRQLALRGAPDAEIAERVAALDALVDTGELNGRSAAYHAQLAAFDVAAAWREVTAPVLVVRGEHDWVVREDDQARVAELARGPVTVADLRDLDHLLGAHADRDASLRDYGIGAFDPAMVERTARWIADLIR